LLLFFYCAKVISYLFLCFQGASIITNCASGLISGDPWAYQPDFARFALAAW